MNELTIIGCASIILLAFVLRSCYMHNREKRAKFKRELQGYKFGSLKELQDYWRGTMDISFDGDFDPNYHGNLLETLKTIDEAVRKEWIHWNS